jgi:hypothetical protein
MNDRLSSSHTKRSRRCVRGVSLGLLFPLIGCLDASGPEKAGYSAQLLAPDAEVPLYDSDDALRARLDAADNQDSPMIPLRSGYVGGREVHYWDFGVVPIGTKPVWVFRAHGEDGGTVDTGHPDLIDSVPGDTGYTSFRKVYLVYFTKAYTGQRITSMQALEDALELGLLEEPFWKDAYVNWPVALADAKLEVGPDETPLSPDPVYYRGRITHHFKLGPARGPGSFAIEKPPIPWPNAYQLRRQDEARPLDEAAWRADLNGDGDTTDSNVVFSVAPGDMGYTSLWKQVDVIVPPNYAWGSDRSESDLFQRQMQNLDAVSGAVVEYSDSLLYLNRPIQGSLP